MVKAFKCDGVAFCAKCYLDILNETTSLELVVTFTKVADVPNDFRCEDCGELCSSMESLNSLKHIEDKLPKPEAPKINKEGEVKSEI